jgi:hypothetical protein
LIGKISFQQKICRNKYQRPEVLLYKHVHMKNSLAIILLLGCFAMSAQSISTFDTERKSKQKTGMLVLSSWAIVNLAVSPFLAKKSLGSQKYFHQMNGYWNIVNLGIAGVGLLSQRDSEEISLLSKLITEQSKIEKVLLFNAGLDLGYVMTGLYLTERAKNSPNGADRLKGFGQSMMLQGGFLFAFDVALYLVMHQTHLKIINWSDTLQISVSATSLVLRF